MKYLSFAIVLLAGVIAFAFNYTTVDFEKDEEEGIQFFRGNWEAAKALAAKENKIIFLDIYASWCGPCKALKRNTFSDSEVGTFYNKHFINVALDGEAGEGSDLAQKYRIKGYPTLLFMDSNGQLIKKAAGYHNPKAFLSLGKKTLK